MGGSPGLVVMGGDLCSEGSNPSTVHWWYIFLICFKKTKINEKEAAEGPFFKKRIKTFQ